jgi:biopolymer transport protein ExbB/TolQ
MYPLFAAGDVNALAFSAKQVSGEGYITMGMLALVSLVSWSVIINKFFQLRRARSASRKFFAAWKESKDPMDIARSGKEFDGAPAYEVYRAAAEDVDYHLSKHPLMIKGEKRISLTAFDLVKSTLSRTAGAEAMQLEKGMIVLTTAVAGGPFIGLLGTVFGVMETFAGIAIKQAASITAMAPGVAGALLNTVVGLFVAIPAMFAYNFQVTNIRGITNELDNFVSELETAFGHRYVDNRALAEEIRDAVETRFIRLQDVITAQAERSQS